MWDQKGIKTNLFFKIRKESKYSICGGIFLVQERNIQCSKKKGYPISQVTHDDGL